MNRTAKHLLSILVAQLAIITALVITANMSGINTVGASVYSDAPGGESVSGTAQSTDDSDGLNPHGGGAGDSFPGVTVWSPPPPHTPKGLAVINPGTGRALYLSWTPNQETDLFGYRVYRAKQENGPYVRLGEGDLDAHKATYADETVRRNTIYWYRVSAVNQSGEESAFSVPVAGRSLAPPDPPRGLEIVEEDTGQDLKLSWLPNTEADLYSYLIYRTAEEEGLLEQVAQVDSKTTAYRDQGLIQGQWYHYYIAAVDTLGQVSSPSTVVQARPRQGLRVSTHHDDAYNPGAVFLSVDSTAVFLNKRGDHIELKARAVDAAGQEVPLAGTWRFAADFGRIVSTKITGGGSAQAYFQADAAGCVEIAVEFYPTGARKPAVTDAVAVRALEWHLVLDNTKKHTVRAGSEDLLFTVSVVDGLGQPVTDPAAQVSFETVGPGRSNDKERKRPKVGPWHGDAYFSVIWDGQKVGVPQSSPGPDGRVEAVLIAGTTPGQERVKAVLRYDDFSGFPGQPKPVDESGQIKIKVEPGKARYLGWTSESVTLDGLAPVAIKPEWRDAFGNPTGNADGVKTWVQVPAKMPLEISADKGKTWMEAGRWLDFQPGRDLQVRIATTVDEVPAGNYLVTTRVEGLESGLPPGLAQVNPPLPVSVTETVVVNQGKKGPWIIEVRSLLDRVSTGLLSFIQGLAQLA